MSCFVHKKAGRILFVLSVIVTFTIFRHAAAQTGKSGYLNYVRAAADTGWEAYPGIIESWREDVDPSVLWGYNPPGQPVYLADVSSFIYDQTGESEYARRAAQLLTEFGRLRGAYPPEYADTRAEYEDGIPALVNMFLLSPYTRAYMRVRDSGQLTDAEKAEVETNIAESMNFVFHFPEWGAHNRAIIRAEGLYYGYLALPDHPDAPRWRQMAEVLASDNLKEWEIEDATHYNPIWLVSLFNYADVSGHDELFESPIMRYYAEFYKQLFTPAHNIPDVGDADWNPGWSYYVAAFERFANEYQDAELKWEAEKMFETLTPTYRDRGVTAGMLLSLAYQWSDDSLEPQMPTTRTQEVLDDVVGKKVVFRDGWEPESTYLLVNYRDEGMGGFNDREYLRNTITVEEEKMHHGSSDGNSISLFMNEGAVLLHDGGYRSGLPSGPYGQYRSDYYHNRLVVRKNKRDRYQSVRDFIFNSGAHRQIRTQKIDVLTLDEVDMSRTRLYDEKIGYSTDRIVTYVKPLDVFVVIDAVEVLEEDYYTFTNLWHTQTIHEQGPHYYDTSLDSIGSFQVPQNRRLLIQFLETYAKEDSVFEENRYYQPEKAIYQTQSSQYRSGDFEAFVTVLAPHDPNEPIGPIVEQFEIIPMESFPKAVGVKITHGGRVSYLGAKLDLQSEIVRENIRPRYTWEAGRTTYGPIETDAHFFFATVTGDSIRYSASEFVKVRYEDQTLVEALPNTHGLQPDGGPDRTGFVKWRYWEDAVELD